MKDLKISKELLSEVLKLEVVKHSLFNKLHNSFNITYMQSEDSLKSSWMPINIHEFAFKCKEWLIKNNFSYMVYYDDYFKDYKCTILSIIGCEKRETFIANTEIKSTIKACEWILNEETL